MFRKLITILLFGILPIVSSGQDLAISPIIVGPTSGCNLPNNSIITIIIVNIGGPFVTGFDISYSLNAGLPVSETVLPAFIPMGWTYNYSFIAPADFSACQIHTLDFVLTVPGDVNLANNTLSVSVTSDCAPIPGTITAPDTLCSGINSGNLLVTGYTGNVQNWIFSTTGGPPWNWLPNTTSTQPYSNINTQMQWWVLMGSLYGFCPDDSTAIVTIEVVPQSVAGTLPLNFDICDNGNGGQLDLVGSLGDVLNWEISQDGGITWIPIPNTTDSLLYSNLMDTTMYHVQVQNNICPAVYSAPVTLTLIPGTNAGSIVGENLVCNFENDSSFEVNPIVGDVVGWYFSNDNGATWIITGVTDTIYPYAGVLNNTIFAAVIQESSCAFDTAFHSLVVLPLGITAGPNVSIFEEDSTQLVASGGSLFLWFPANYISDPNISNPIVWPLTTTTYFVQITDFNGCTDTAFVVVTVLPNITTVIVPNLLTPNSDGFNDYLNIPNIDTYPNNELYIFNSYGEVIFHETPYNNNWDATYGGANVPDGTYYYVLNLNDPVNAPDPYQGVITILGNE